MYDDILRKLISEKFINKEGKVSPWIERKISNQLREEIVQLTNFLVSDVTLSDRVKTVQLGIIEQPRCLFCNKPTKFHRELKGFAKYCSNACYNSSEEKSKLMSNLASEGKLAIGIKAKEYQHKKYNGLMAIQADPTITKKIKDTCIKNMVLITYLKPKG